MELFEKFQNLKTYLSDLEKVAVAFSGGVDSTFLLSMAHKALGDKVIAITAHTHIYPQKGA